MPNSAKIWLIIQQTEGGQPLTLTAIQSATAVQTFIYKGGSNVHSASVTNHRTERRQSPLTPKPFAR